MDIRAASRLVRIGSTILWGARGTTDEVNIAAKIEKALRAGKEVTENGVTRSIWWRMHADDFIDFSLGKHIWNEAGTKVRGTLVEARTEGGETTERTLGKKFKTLEAAWGDNSEVPGKFD